MGMKVGVSQLIMPREMGVEEFMQKAAAAGYEAVELACRDEGDVTPDTPPEKAREIARRAAELGLELTSMTHGHSRDRGNLLADGDARRYGVDRTKQALEVAAAMGIRCTLHTLGRLAPDLYYDEAWRNGVRSLKELAPAAEALGVDIAVEFVWNGFLFSPLEMKRFIEEVGSPAIGFYFDPGNMAVFQFPQHWVRILGPHIKRVHLKDWKGRALNGQWTPLLEGALDFETIMRELRAAGYDAPLISEVSLSLASLEDTAATIRRIREMGRAGT